MKAHVALQSSDACAAAASRFAGGNHGCHDHVSSGHGPRAHGRHTQRDVRPAAPAGMTVRLDFTKLI